MNKPFFFNIRVLDINGFELQFAVHEIEFQRFRDRVDAVLRHITERGYRPIQSREAWLQTLTTPPTQLPF